MIGSRRVRPVAYVLGAMLLAGACGVPDEGRFVPLEASEIPDVLVATSVASTDASVEREEVDVTTTVVEILYDDVELYFVSANRVVRSQRLIVSPATPTQVLDTLLTGLDDATQDAGLRSALPRGMTATIDVRRGVARVSAASPFLSELEPLDQRLAIAQIVLTLTRRPGIGQVIFNVDGADIPVPRGAGDLTSPGSAVTYDDYLAVLSASG